jgi:hemerythrin-like domain-containing protein
MLRDKNLIPLSHQHQHALALCVRIDRASPIAEEDVAPWQDEIAQQFQGEIAIHFAAEEGVLFPEAKRFEELVPLISELLAEHSDLRSRLAVATAGRMSGSDLLALAQGLSQHIRKEERQLFERLQQLLSTPEMADIGTRLEKAMQDAVQVCALPKKQ